MPELFCGIYAPSKPVCSYYKPMPSDDPAKKPERARKRFSLRHQNTVSFFVSALNLYTRMHFSKQT